MAVSVTLAIAGRRAHAVVGGRRARARAVIEDRAARGAANRAPVATGGCRATKAHRWLQRDQRALSGCCRSRGAAAIGAARGTVAAATCGRSRAWGPGAIVRRTRGGNFKTAKVALRTLEQSRQQGLSSKDR